MRNFMKRRFFQQIYNEWSALISEREKSHEKENLTYKFLWTFHTVCICNCASMCLCVSWSHGVLAATRGPSCRLPACPRILLGVSHTWVAHSSWTLHIQIAVMNIIREEHRGDVQGTHTNTLSYGVAQTHMSTVCAHKYKCALYCALIIGDFSV